MFCLARPACFEQHNKNAFLFGSHAVQAVHPVVRCINCIGYTEDAARLVILGDDGSSGQAKTGQQLASALSLSVWELSREEHPKLVNTWNDGKVYC